MNKRNQRKHKGKFSSESKGKGRYSGDLADRIRRWLLRPHILLLFVLIAIVVAITLTAHWPTLSAQALSMVLTGVMGTCLLAVLLLLSLRWTKAFLSGFLFFFAALIPTMSGIRFWKEVIASENISKKIFMTLLSIIELSLLF